MSRLTLSPTGTELLDDPGGGRCHVALSLRNIARANWWFGGWAAVRYRAAPAPHGRAPRDKPVTLLDVGTGMGDMPRHGRRWAAGGD